MENENARGRHIPKCSELETIKATCSLIFQFVHLMEHFREIPTELSIPVFIERNVFVFVSVRLLQQLHTPYISHINYQNGTAQVQGK